MVKISGLPDGAVPRDSDFKFRARAAKLVAKWQSAIHAAPKAAAPAAAAAAVPHDDDADAEGEKEA